MLQIAQADRFLQRPDPSQPGRDLEIGRPEVRYLRPGGPDAFRAVLPDDRRRSCCTTGCHPSPSALPQPSRTANAATSRQDPVDVFRGLGVLVVRKRRADGGEFLGCSKFPTCKFTRRI
jgi:hypothetical protein